MDLEVMTVFARATPYWHRARNVTQNMSLSHGIGLGRCVHGAPKPERPVEDAV